MSDILKWKLQTLEDFLNIEYTKHLHFRLGRNLHGNKRVIKLDPTSVHQVNLFFHL
jgi:hypothetical protein